MPGRHLRKRGPQTMSRRWTSYKRTLPAPKEGSKGHLRREPAPRALPIWRRFASGWLGLEKGLWKSRRISYLN